MQDIITLVGLGPNNLAIAYNLVRRQPRANITIIEHKPTFSWHSDYPKGSLQIDAAKASITTVQDDPMEMDSYLRRRFHLSQNEVLSSRLSHDDYRAYMASALTRLRARAENLQFRWNTSLMHVVNHCTHYVLECHDHEHDRPVILPASQVSIGTGAVHRLVSADEIPISAFLSTAKERLSPLIPSLVQIAGSGQSAGDAICNLLDGWPQTRIDWVVPHGVPRRADENRFVNLQYTYDAAMCFHAANEQSQRGFMAHMRHTNHGVITDRTLERIISGHDSGRVRVLPSPDPSGDYAIKFAATGFVPMEQMLARFLPSVPQPITLDADFRLAGQDIFVPGGLPHTHGPTAGTICDLGRRAEAVVEALLSSSLSKRRMTRGQHHPAA